MKFIMQSFKTIRGKRQIDPYQKAQKYVDSECIRRMAPYTKKLTGALIKSATINTKIGSGEIIQDTPYARYQYYSDDKRAYATSEYEDMYLRGSYWFERMKTDHKTDILKGVKLITGGKIR